MAATLVEEMSELRIKEPQADLLAYYRFGHYEQILSDLTTEVPL